MKRMKLRIIHLVPLAKNPLNKMNIRAYLMILGILTSLLACKKKVDEDSKVEINKDIINKDSIINNAITISEVFEYSYYYKIPEKTTRNDISSSNVLISQLSSFDFLSNKKLFPIKDTIIQNSNLFTLIFSANDYYVNSLMVRNINERFVHFMFTFDSLENDGIKKNGFYLYDKVSEKTLFIKCLPNDLPFSKEIKFANISTIAFVDANLIEQKFFSYDKLILTHVGDVKGSKEVNIRFPSPVNKLNYVKINEKINVEDFFKIYDELDLSTLSIRQLYEITPKREREINTVKWGLGYYN